MSEELYGANHAGVAPGAAVVAERDDNHAAGPGVATSAANGLRLDADRAGTNGLHLAARGHRDIAAIAGHCPVAATGDRDIAAAAVAAVAGRVRPGVSPVSGGARGGEDRGVRWYTPVVNGGPIIACGEERP